MLIALAGLPGTGKTTLAGHLAARLPGVVLDKDRIWACLFPPGVTSHMFRKRAFTLAFVAGLDARKAAIAIGCNVDTMMKHYVSLDEQAVTDEVFAELQGRLLLPKKQE
jgi:dephospho-CoA kinase